MNLIYRSWDKVYLVLRTTALLAYKDQKHFKNEPEAYYRSEFPVDLKEATVEVATDYTKKKHVFRLKLSNGAEYLFQAKEDEEMNLWMNKLGSVIMEVTQGVSSGPSRSQTLPAKSESEKKDEPKKKSFFTLKKK